jgi:hypothetical protein
MVVWYSLWSFGIYFPIWYVWTKKNLATLLATAKVHKQTSDNKMVLQKINCNRQRRKMTSEFPKMAAGWTKWICGGKKIHYVS